LRRIRDHEGVERMVPVVVPVLARRLLATGEVVPRKQRGNPPFPAQHGSELPRIGAYAHPPLRFLAIEMGEVASCNPREILRLVKLPVEEIPRLVLETIHCIWVETPALVAGQLVGAEENVVIDIFP